MSSLTSLNGIVLASLPSTDAKSPNRRLYSDSRSSIYAATVEQEISPRLFKAMAMELASAPELCDNDAKELPEPRRTVPTLATGVTL
jgi:hypothetical protein